MKKRAGLLIYFTGLLFGMVLGVLLWNILVAGKIDALHKRNMFLETSLEECRTKLEKLMDSQPEKEQTLKDVVVYIELDNELERMILEKTVKQKYDVLLGKRTKEIDLDLVIQVIDKRLFRTDKYQYQLIVDKVALSSSLTLWISVKENNAIELE
jgi:hypothetical protein